MKLVDYFEKNYLGELKPESEVRQPPLFPVEFWNHYVTVCADPEFPRTSNMVEGFHRGFRTRIHRARPSVTEYFRAVREQQVITDFHVDRLEVGICPSKRRKTTHHELYEIVSKYETYESNLAYLFDIAKHFGHE